MRLALKTSLQKFFSNRLTLKTFLKGPKVWGFKNALIRGFPNDLNSNTAPNIVLANVDGIFFSLY